MAILTGTAIRNAVERCEITIVPFNICQVGANSYDLTLGDELLVYDVGEDEYIDSARIPRVKSVEKKQSPSSGKMGWFLEPGRLYLGSTVEFVATQKFIPQLDGRSSFARLGATAQLSAGFGDLAFAGQWTLEITVVQPLIIYPLTKVCQVFFTTPHGDIDIHYQGRYQGQQGPTPSRM